MESLNSVLQWLILALLFVFLVKYNWERRWLHYHVWNIPGPSLSWPVLGNGCVFLGNSKEFLEKLLKVASALPPVFKLWFGQDLVIFTSKPEDVDFILNNHLGKGQLMYKWAEDFSRDGLITQPLTRWKKHRKIINPTFNPQNMNSFSKIFDKHSRILVKNMEEMCEKNFDVLQILWQAIFDIACETILDIDPALIENRYEYISNLQQFEEILALRISKPWLYVDTIWKLSSISRKLKTITSQNFDYLQSIINTKKSLDVDPTNAKRFMNHLFSSNDVTETEILEHTNIMLLGATETSATTLAFAMLILGLFPKIQEKVYRELYSIFGETNRNTNLEDLNRMEYLEAFLKETMRMFPSIPGVLRYLEKDYSTKSYVYPRGATICIFIAHIHRNPEFWEDPEIFSPERFLKGNAHKIQRGTYLPFSLGARNCIGFKYGLMSMKFLLSNLLRHYKVDPPADYSSISDIKMIFNVVTKANKNFRVKLQSRNINRIE